MMTYNWCKVDLVHPKSCPRKINIHKSNLISPIFNSNLKFKVNYIQLNKNKPLRVWRPILVNVVWWAKTLDEVIMKEGVKLGVMHDGWSGCVVLTHKGADNTTIGAFPISLLPTLLLSCVAPSPWRPYNYSM